MVNWKSIKEFGLNSLIIFGMATVGKMMVTLVIALLGALLLGIAALFGA